MTLLAAKPFSEDTADKLGVSKRTVERLVQTAANLTPEAKKTIRDAGDKISKQYRSHAATIRRWIADDRRKGAPVSRDRDYRVREGDTV